ncbi:MAG TPA: type I polyketide synthase [Pyrinomonadaceae bacterium]|nr:type I polyketide synthase [Pyrinomonadaceae bacterium]
MTASISIVGIACCYPDARNTTELWENVVAQRRAFRRLPDRRLRLADYWSNNRETRDSFYSSNAALIKGYEFNRTRFRVAGSTFRSADMAHWLALDVAAQVLEDGGFPEAKGLPRDSTGVFVGNTLTGEFSRANALRLRWPYVRRTLSAALQAEDWSREHRESFLSAFEEAFKKPFAPVGEETLAGGLSNTIAGRICNHFDLRGGGYTVDGACASSLLAVANACTALAAGDLDAALVGGVDLSLDPFELVGFAKTGALAADEMRVYDEGSNGFWPGEGCGFVLLLRTADALAQGLRVCAQIKGWAISSDGHGGITRPEIEGQRLVLKRAYAKAGFDIGTVAYFEGHGTGTSVGDAVELKALSSMIGKTDYEAPAAIGSIKANIGHTKAAAGIAGLIKSAMALHHRVIPPTTGCINPHSILRGKSASLRPVRKAESWPVDRALRAGVSAMGFGGVNAHVVLEADKTQTGAPGMDQLGQSPACTAQDAELFLWSARDVSDLRSDIDRVLSFAPELSLAELSDLAAHLQSSLNDGRVRAAVVASTPVEFAERLAELRSAISTDVTFAKRGVFFSSDTRQPRIGFLFPGQGSPSYPGGGGLRRRFDFVDQLYSQARLDPHAVDLAATVAAQPAIVTASLAALRVLNELDITARIAVGHSLGELTALHWGGAMDQESLLRIARARGNAMTGPHIVPGAMASLSATADMAQSLLNGDSACIAAMNSPVQTVISGPVNSIEKVLALARGNGVKGTKLNVPLAFHSQLLAPAAPVLASHLANERFNRLERKVVSTVTGAELAATADLPELLYQQITAPVRFLEAVTRADAEVDLWLEVGPGQVLTGIVADITTTPCFSIDAGNDSLRGLLTVAAAAFVMGQLINHRALFSGRFTRPFDLDWKPQFLVNPCELAPIPDENVELTTRNLTIAGDEHEAASTPATHTPVLEILRQLVAERAELPASTIDAENRFLSDLHLNSITVSQLIGETARRVNLPVPITPTEFADAKISEVAELFDEQLKNGLAAQQSDAGALPAGLDSWVRAFKVELIQVGPAHRPNIQEPGSWVVFSATRDEFVESLQAELAGKEFGDAVAVCLSPDPDETVIDLLLEAARLALAAKKKSRFVLIQQGKSAASFARTLYAEAPRIDTCVITIPPAHPQAVDWVITEGLAAKGYVEVQYDEAGRRWSPVVRSLELPHPSGTLPLSRKDLLIVTGGGKGITAECALALAKESGARMVLIGQAQPESDQELSTNLSRFAAAHIDFRYFATDITDAARVRQLITNVEKELGPVTGIIHGAARNVPRLLSKLDAEGFRQTLAVKVQGARNLLAAIDPGQLRLLVTFGSIIARSGLPGEADYGLANEWLAQLTEEWGRAHPSCRCLSVEWSVWSGQGMGARLGRTRLLQQGVTPISPEQGVEALRALLVQPLPIVPVVVMSRFRDLPTFRIERPELPFLRFLEEAVVYFPGVELIAEFNLATDSDPYLKDHQFQGERLFPAVMGLEAMVQVATALAGSNDLPVLEDVRFDQPVIAPATGSLRVRIAALRQEPNDVVAVALRSAATGFQVNHFQARCSFKKAQQNGNYSLLLDDSANSSRIDVDPHSDLYGDLLFHTGCFRRLASYRRLKARECIAEITPSGGESWFIQYLPPTLLLGDPGSRDAAIHAIQACIPHLTLLPTGVRRLTIDRAASDGPRVVRARERFADGNTFVYDLVVTESDGTPCERWEGLSLKAVSRRSTNAAWISSLLTPYLERRVRELMPASEMSVALLQDAAMDLPKRSAAAFSALLDPSAVILRRPDGKPEVTDGSSVSAAHRDDLTFAVASPGRIGCDLEQVMRRSPSAWRMLIGDDGMSLVQLIQRQVGENSETAATRVWSAKECLKKVGAMANAPLVFVSASEDGWVTLSSGLFTIVTYRTQIRDHGGGFVFAMLASAGHADAPRSELTTAEVNRASV